VKILFEKRFFVEISTLPDTYYFQHFLSLRGVI